jgi:aldehyde:ferredoxin oxidoreductase
LSTTISYVLDYNVRLPDRQLFNGAIFGDFEKINELIQETGKGQMSEIGRGVKRLSEQTGETDYGMHVKSLQLPACLPETIPGYPWSIAGGHMAMGTHLSLIREGQSDLEYWIEAITQKGILASGYDMIGLCKFLAIPVNHELIIKAISAATGLEFTATEVEKAVKKSIILGLALE